MVVKEVIFNSFYFGGGCGGHELIFYSVWFGERCGSHEGT